MRAAIVLSCWVAGCTPLEGAPATRQPILGGAADPNSTSVFLVISTFNTGQQGFCTGTLISPRVILTAGHCVDPARENASAVMVRVMNEPDDTMLVMSDLLNVVAIRRHPQYTDQGAHDLALLQLENPVPNVTPELLPRTPPASWNAQPIRVVGYGRTRANGASDTGTRRTVNSQISRVMTDTFEFGQAGMLGICAGDSGGPSFWRAPDGRDRVVGVHSYGTTNQCGVGGDVRVDRELTFIDGALNQLDPPMCIADGRCQLSCMPADPDCRCVADGRCEACMGGPLDPDCPANCATNSICQSSGCPVPDTDCLADGDVCAVRSECAGDACLADPRGFLFCSRPCTDDTVCTREMICTEGVCRPPASTTMPPPPAQGVTGGCQTSPLPPWPLLLLLLAVRPRCSTRG